MSGKTMRIGTRGSPLALAQAHETRDRLAAAHALPADRFEIVVIKTTGDAILDRPLAEAGGKGLFTRELDAALIAGTIDIAVHSAKDVPTFLPDEIAVAGFLPREDARDAFIGRGGARFADLPAGAIVGSASLRRQAQVRRLRPELRVELLRGNVQTRLGKVASGAVEGTLLALAGLKRLGLSDRATEILDADAFLPPVGQAAICIAARAGDAHAHERLAPILHDGTGDALACERAFLAVLDGSCRTPIAGHATLSGERLSFRGRVLRMDGSQVWDVAVEGPRAEAAALGAAAGRDLLARVPADALAHS